MASPDLLTEADLTGRLRSRYGRLVKNGSHESIRYIMASQVRHSPLWPRCIADFLVLDTWGNSGYTDSTYPLIGFEIKVSRSDYLSEIKNLDKSAPFREVCKEWYVVVSDRSIVRDDLPDGWGLMVPRGEGLVIARRPRINLCPEPMPRSLVAGFMRAAVTQSVHYKRLPPCR